MNTCLGLGRHRRCEKKSVNDTTGGSQGRYSIIIVIALWTVVALLITRKHVSRFSRAAVAR